MQVIDEVASLVEELTPDFIKEFAVYLCNDRGLASSTIWLTCMHLKGVVGRAHDNGKIQRNVFAQFHISPKCKERTFLTEDDGEHQSSELKTVMEHEFEDGTLQHTTSIPPLVHPSIATSLQSRRKNRL